MGSNVNLFVFLERNSSAFRKGMKTLCTVHILQSKSADINWCDPFYPALYQIRYIKLYVSSFFRQMLLKKYIFKQNHLHEHWKWIDVYNHNSIKHRYIMTFVLGILNHQIQHGQCLSNHQFVCNLVFIKFAFLRIIFPKSNI